MKSEATALTLTLDPAVIGATLAPCEAAEARALVDFEFKTLLGHARGAGTVYGSAQGKSESGKLYAELADAISMPAAVALGIRTNHDGDQGSELLPTAEAAPILLVELFGVVQESVKSAQKAAARAMRNIGQGSKAKAAEASARKSITQGINRGLAGYGIKADFYACRVECIETPDEETDAEKAEKACAAAFARDFIGACNAFSGFDLAQIVALETRLSQYRAKAEAEEKAEDEATAESREAAEKARKLEAQRILKESQAKESRASAAAVIDQAAKQAATGKKTATK